MLTTQKKFGLFIALVVPVAMLTTLGAATANAAPQGNGLRPAGGIGAPTSTFEGAKSATGRLAKTDPSLLGKSGKNAVNVMIKYDFDAPASYTGGVKGLSATSPAATGKSLKNNAPAVNAYGRYTATKASSISAAVQRAVPATKISETYRAVYGGVAARVPADSVAALLKVPGVAAVQHDTVEHPLDDNTSFIGATSVWPSLGGSANAGSGVVVANLDSGVWPEHPMLSPTGISAPAGGLKGCSGFDTSADVANLGPAFACNNKLIGAYAFVDHKAAEGAIDATDFCNPTTKVCSARDSEGHGTHTTTTTVGDCVPSAVALGVDHGPTCGIAPGAHVIEYRVCIRNSCNGADAVAAIQQAITDGVNVINFSISGGTNPYADATALAFLDATNAGISVNASAGNGGPGAGSVQHVAPWITTVGSSSGPREYRSTVHLTATGGGTLDLPGVNAGAGVTNAPVMWADHLPGETFTCEHPLAPGTATGKVVLCADYNGTRGAKSFNVMQGGAVGVILYNIASQPATNNAGNDWLPTVKVDPFREDFDDFVNAVPDGDVHASWVAGQPTPTTPDVMAKSSARGPLGDWLKPDVTAPGVNVFAGYTPQTRTTDLGPGQLYATLAGTSMAAPHAAGVAALVKSAHPDWTPEEIKSALMTSSVQTVVKEDGVTPADPFDMGAGSIRADRAVNPTVVFDETYANFVASSTDVLHRIDRNIPSIDATTMSGSITTQRTAKNVTAKSVTLGVKVTQPPGVTITVGKKNGNLAIKKGGSLTFPITISAPEAPNGQYLARITLTPKTKGATPVTIPVAFVKKAATVTLSHSCSPSTLPIKTATHCVATLANPNYSPADAKLDVSQKASTGAALKYSNVGLPGTPVKKTKGVHWEGAVPAQAPPQVTAIPDITGGGSAFGYIPLSSFNAPDIGLGDEGLKNFSVPTFYYGGEAYSSVGVVSNGYVVIGGGTNADVLFDPQSFPNAAAPNNVLAPLWTDLDPSAGGAVRVTTLTDSVSSWVVVDWDHVRDFSDATTHSFEIWLRTADGPGPVPAANEQITMSYAPDANAAAGDPSSGSTWGAENRFGTSGLGLLSAPADSSDYRPTLSAPVPGTLTIPFDITSSSAKTLWSYASMTSSSNPGVTIVPQQLTFTKH